MNNTRMSSSIQELAKALNKVQSQMCSAKADARNPFYNSAYADLGSVWDAIRKPLTDNGLSVAQLPVASNGTVILETVLLHTSGEWISGEISMHPAKDDPQGVGSCLTYARRYGLCAILGVTVDEDDDGNLASRIKRPQIHQVRPRNDATMVRPATDRYTGEPIRQEDGADFVSPQVERPDQQASDAPAPSPIKAFCDDQANKAAADEHTAEGFIGSHTPRLAGKQAPPGRFTLDTLHGEITLQYWDRPDGLGTPNHSYAKVTYRQSERTGKGGKVFTNNELLSLQWAAPPQ